MNTKTVRKAVENKENAKEQRENDTRVYDTEEILGSMTTVRRFAKFFEKNKVDLEVARACMLLDYCDAVDFTSQEKRAYELGLGAMFRLFESAGADVDTYMRESEQQNQRVIKNPVG